MQSSIQADTGYKKGRIIRQDTQPAGYPVHKGCTGNAITAESTAEQDKQENIQLPAQHRAPVYLPYSTVLQEERKKSNHLFLYRYRY
jgi:hypothetical protein